MRARAEDCPLGDALVRRARYVGRSRPPGGRMVRGPAGAAGYETAGPELEGRGALAMVRRSRVAEIEPPVSPRLTDAVRGMSRPLYGWEDLDPLLERIG